MYYGRRSVQIFKIWEDVFGGHDRLVRVVAWQAAAGDYWTDRLLLANCDAANTCDALAVAPYVTLCIGPGTKPTSGEVSGWSLDRLFAHVESESLPNAVAWMKTQKKFAEKYGLMLIAYEAGQHLVGVGGGENNEAMTRLFQQANRDPRMGEVYQKYFAAWADAGGDLVCHFSSLGSWSKWGSWGLAEYDDESPSACPKYTEVLETARRWGQPVRVP